MQDRHTFSESYIDNALEKMTTSELQDLLTSFILDTVLKRGISTDWAVGITVTRKRAITPINRVVQSTTVTTVDFGEVVSAFVLYTNADLRVRIDGATITPGWTGNGFFVPAGSPYAVENIETQSLYLRAEAGSANVSIQALTLS